MQQLEIIGVDLAKMVFQVHGVGGQPALDAICPDQNPRSASGADPSSQPSAAGAATDSNNQCVAGTPGRVRDGVSGAGRRRRQGAEGIAAPDGCGHARDRPAGAALPGNSTPQHGERDQGLGSAVTRLASDAGREPAAGDNSRYRGCDGHGARGSAR